MATSVVQWFCKGLGIMMWWVHTPTYTEWKISILKVTCNQCDQMLEYKVAQFFQK